MLVSDIKNKASEIMYSSKDILFKVFVVMAIITTLANSIGGLIGGITGLLIGFIIMIAFLPFGHGYVVASLKAVNNNSETISIEEDSFVGFKRFKELFGTYFIYNFFMFIILFIIILMGIVFLVIIAPNISTLDFSSAMIDPTNPVSVITALGIDFIMTIIYLLLAIIIAVCVVILLYDLNFGLAPFLLERKGLRGTAAMKESMHLMKGYKWLLFKVQLSFVGWIILCGIIGTIIGAFLPIALIVNLINVVIAIFLYESKMKVCYAVLFEEIMIENSIVD